MKKLIITLMFMGALFSQDKFVTTAYDSRLLTNPDSNAMLLRIPKNIELKILDSQEVQQGRMKNTWYKVSYKGKTGWTSAFDMKNPPKAKVTDVKTMYQNYESKIGKKPENSCYKGSVCIVRDWLYENEPNYKYVDFKVWHPVIMLDSKWVSRVEYQINNRSYDKLFYIVNSKVVKVKNKR
jgi:hypothetical protein|tara:strand:+ start:68 stop:610 length:543 start_codon:yes stop_codon:yes gene_type:complete